MMQRNNTNTNNTKTNSTTTSTNNTNKMMMATTSSMTIDEMRALHHQALVDAEAKRTELRLVLASRYRELVGSSDEVLRMRERAQELHQLIQALPVLLEKVETNAAQQQQQSSAAATATNEEEKVQDIDDSADNMVVTTANLSQELARLPREIHRALDHKDVYTASVKLMELMTLLAPYEGLTAAQSFVVVAQKKMKQLSSLPPPLQMQLRMTHRQCCLTLPQRILRMAKQQLLVKPSSNASDDNNNNNAAGSSPAQALASIQMLEQNSNVGLLDLYFDSKATVLQSLLQELQETTSDKAESILCQMVVILQKDIILHPHFMFCCSNNSEEKNNTTTNNIRMTMERDLVRAKVSHFLAAHLPLIRERVKSVLMDIAGTTAHALGQIRQSLYDVTNDYFADWTEAVRNVVDVKIVLQQQQQAAASLTTEPSSSSTTTTFSSMDDHQRNKFSLWSALFSNTFSNLVHSLLTSSFHSVHTQVVTSLKTSLANAPPHSKNVLPHEAHRNTLSIATNLDDALKKVSDDAHELLVHAEEREDSERRLRQSLYVQTCESMGRLLCELRRMVVNTTTSSSATTTAEDETTTTATTTSSSKSSNNDTKEYVVGRLCHLLQYRLKSLATLLQPSHKPNAVGMITRLELRSAFELADDDDDGLITWEEAMEAVDAAFSGTAFRGSEMIRETWKGGAVSTTNAAAGAETTTTTHDEEYHHHHRSQQNNSLTLPELSLLSARGLQLEALETIQQSLSTLIETCFSTWAVANIPPPALLSLDSYLYVTRDESEWQRLFYCNDNRVVEETTTTALPDFKTYLEQQQQDTSTTASASAQPPRVGSVSPHVIGYLMRLSGTFQQSICPADGIELCTTIRTCLLQQALPQVVNSCCCNKNNATTTENNIPISALMQWYLDSTFLQKCFCLDHASSSDTEQQQQSWTQCHETLRHDIQQQYYSNDFQSMVDEKHVQAWESSELYFIALLDEQTPFGTTTTTSDGDNNTTTNWQTPLVSSRRFMELSIPTDRRFLELQRRSQLVVSKNNNKVEKQQQAANSKSASAALGGFFSSMLKK